MHSNKKQIIISGIISVFLVTTLAVTSTLISNPNFSLDIRNYAKQTNEDEGGYTNKQTIKAPSNVDKPKSNKPSDLEEEEQTHISTANVSPVATLTPNPSPTQAPLINADTWSDEPTTSTVTMKDSTGKVITNEQYQAALKASTPPTVTYSYTETDKTGQTTAVTSSNDHNEVEKVTTNDGITKTEVITVKPTNNTDYVKTNKVTTTDEDNIIIDTKTSTTQTVTQTSSSTLPSGNTVETKTIITTNETGQVIDKVVVTAATPAPVVTNAQESQSFWQQLGNKFNDASTDTGLVGMGTGGLGMDGSTTAIPQSVITSKDPEAVNNYLVGSTLALAAGAGAAAATVAAPVVYSAGPAIAAYGSATISTAVASLPAAVQTGLAIAGTATTIAAPALGMNQCVQSGDPNSPACIGMVTGYMSNPLEVEYALSDSINSVKSIVTKPTIATSNLPDFNLNVSTTHLPGFNNNDVLIEQVSNRIVTIKTGGQYISMDLDDPKLAKIVNESTNELAGLQGEDYWDKLYDIRGSFGESEFATSTEKNAYDIAQELAVKTNTPIPLSEILEKKQAICLELSCILSLVNGNAENKIKTMAVDIFVPANGFELGHAANSSLTSDPINRLDNFNPIFNQENIGAIQRVNFWSE